MFRKRVVRAFDFYKPKMYPNQCYESFIDQMPPCFAACKIIHVKIMNSVYMFLLNYVRKKEDTVCVCVCVE